MNTTAIRFDGQDLRLETFELPKMRDDEILASVVADMCCPSTTKAIRQGTAHARVPHDVAQHPVMIGHEFCGEILEVGTKWRHRYRPGQRYIMQTALNYNGSLASPGYSYPYVGGNATKVIIPNEVMELNCLLILPPNQPYYAGCLAEPASCILGAFNTMYHTQPGSYTHHMGLRPGGNLLILGGAGPMGMIAVECALHLDTPPARIIVTDIVAEKLDAAQRIVSPAHAAQYCIELAYVNTAGMDNPAQLLLDMTQGKGYDDVIVNAAVKPLIELGDQVLARDGCLNMFDGPPSRDYMASVNFYNVHYSSTHYVGMSGGTTDDMRTYLSMLERNTLNPAFIVTHIGGLDSVPDTLTHLTSIPGGKKLIYTHLRMPLTAIADFAALGETDPMFAKLARIVQRHNGMWCAEAETYLLQKSL